MEAGSNTSIVHLRIIECLGVYLGHPAPGGYKYGDLALQVGGVSNLRSKIRPWIPQDSSILYNYCWSSPAQTFSGPNPMELETIFYCLRFEYSFFVASYDSQGYGGGIRTRLHMGLYYRFVINYVSPFYNFVKTEQRSPLITVPLSLRAYSFSRKCAQRDATHQRLSFHC
jgi:hypothetical protein